MPHPSQPPRDPTQDPLPPPVVVATAGPGLPVKHLFVPSMHIHSSGDYLLAARWDSRGSEEGDATNEQALYVSRDRGATWILPGPTPFITLAHGSSFPIPSSITGAWIMENTRGETWIYYTINQPFTWGENKPTRSTGGGEIRRVRLHRDSTGGWSAESRSEIIWAFWQPLPDRKGVPCPDLRAISWNGVVRLRSGKWLMSIGARSTVKDPRGAFWPLDRVWVLSSSDDGATWGDPVFVAGGPDRCFAEPTIVETSIPGEIVCLLRVQYRTGNELYRTVSRDAGLTWSVPVPTGLPNVDNHGAKPFLLRARDNTYWLIQTNEHAAVARTNIAVFHTDEKGLLADQWQVVRTLHIGHRAGWWPGSCYGWLAEDPRDGALAAAFMTFDSHRIFLMFTRFTREQFLSGPLVEPNGVSDEHGHEIPTVAPEPSPAGGRVFSFSSTRGRLISTQWSALGGWPVEVRFTVRVIRAPALVPFTLLRAAARNGRDTVCALALRDNGEVWAEANPAEAHVPGVIADGAWHTVRVCFPSPHSVIVTIDGHDPVPLFTKSTAPLTTLTWGGGPTARAECEILLADFSYGIA